MEEIEGQIEGQWHFGAAAHVGEEAWVIIMKEKGVTPSLLVDDLLILTDGKDMVVKFKQAMDATHEYLADMGGSGGGRS